MERTVYIRISGKSIRTRSLDCGGPHVSATLPRWDSQRPYGRSIREPSSVSAFFQLPPDCGDQPTVHTKTSPVPADDGFGRDDDEGLLRSRADLPSDYSEELIEAVEARARMSTLQRDELLTQSKILKKETSPAAKEADQHCEAQRRNETWPAFIAEQW